MYKQVNMQKDMITFSTNWNNKLSCKYFTTLRMSNRFQIGQTYDVVNSKLDTFQVVVIDKRRIMMDQINPFIAGIDTGYTVEETKKILTTMYKNKGVDFDRDPLYLYLLKKVD